MAKLKARGRQEIFRRTSAIMDPALVENFIERALADIKEGEWDDVIRALTQMFKKTGLLCTAYLTAYLAKHEPSHLQLLLDRLEENPM